MRLFLKKDVQEFVIKTLDRYTYKEFLKVPFWNWTSSLIFFKDLITTITKIVWNIAWNNRTLFFHNIFHRLPQ